MSYAAGHKRMVALPARCEAVGGQYNGTSKLGIQLMNLMNAEPAHRISRRTGELSHGVKGVVRTVAPSNGHRASDTDFGREREVILRAEHGPRLGVSLTCRIPLRQLIQSSLATQEHAR